MSAVQQHVKTSNMQVFVTEGAGILLLLGVFPDGWAHLNRPAAETFFIP
ncbi:hypothetical protein ACFQ36_17035 [Arthrobacter sp. GCM10027362]